MNFFCLTCYVTMVIRASLVYPVDWSVLENLSKIGANHNSAPVTINKA